MDDTPGIADIVAMYDKMGKEWNKPRAAQIRMAKEYANKLLTEIPRYDDYSNPWLHFLMGIPISIDDTLCYGEWRILDQFGNTLKEFLFPVHTTHRRNGGRLPTPSLETLCTRCDKPRLAHGGALNMGACPGQFGIYSERFSLSRRSIPKECPHGYVKGDHHWYGCMGVSPFDGP